MRISDLSRASGTPVATIKYYLREGLVPPGTATAANQATYDERHLHRLRLVRVLRDVGGLGIARIREVLEAIADERVAPHRMLGVAHHAVSAVGHGASHDPDVTAALPEIDRFLADLGWRVSGRAPARVRLAQALAALRRLGRDVDADVFLPYAEAADLVAEHELSAAPAAASRAQAVEWVVVGMVVFDEALRALRLLAQEHHSAGRFPQRGVRRRQAAARRRRDGSS